MSGDSQARTNGGAGPTAVAQWSIGTKLRWLIIATPCLVLGQTIAAVAWLTAHEMHAQAERAAQMEVEAIDHAVKGFFHRASVLVRGIAARQRALGPGPDPSTYGYLRALLAATPPREAQGV